MDSVKFIDHIAVFPATVGQVIVRGFGRNRGINVQLYSETRL